MNATWVLPKGANGRLLVYAGNPFVGRPNPVKLAPPAGALASATGGGKLVVSTTALPAGDYAAFFSASSTMRSSLGSVTSLRTTCP